MQPRPEPKIEIRRRRERDGLPVNDRRLARVIASGEWVRIAAGVFVPGKAWRAMRPIDRHYVRVRETVDRSSAHLVVSHFAAAALWGIDLIGVWPTQVDVLVARTSGGRSSGAYRRRTSTASPVTVEWRGHEITTPAQTALDIARVSRFTTGVIALDQARWRRRVGGPLASVEHLTEVFDGDARSRGRRRAAEALAFSTDLSDSVRESEGRVLIDRLGFPTPVLQRRFVLADGSCADTDYYFESFDHAAEFDGVGKYLDPAMLQGRSTEEALIAEKDRGDALRRVVRTLSRWRTPAHREPRLLYDILVGEGLPSVRPRPPHGLKLE